jgi:hypothetical protein
MGIGQGGRTIVPLSKYHGPGWKPNNSRNRLRLGGEWFIVADIPKLTGPQRKRHGVYWLLDKALRSGEFSQVKRCRQCSKFFASYRRKADACSPQCNRDYQNAEYQAKGKFMKRYRVRRTEALQRAQRLRDQGKDIEFIMKKTDLTKLALIRGGVYEVDEI